MQAKIFAMMKYLVSVWLLLALLKLSGFCFFQFGWNSNHDLIEAAFQHEMNGSRSNRPAVEDVSGYLAEYPRCCSVGNPALFDQSPILDAIFLRRFYAVTIKYPVAGPANNDGEPFYESTLMMDCCGKDVSDSYGTGSSIAVPSGPAPKARPRTKRPAY
jgi:hypothetical protein